MSVFVVVALGVVAVLALYALALLLPIKHWPPGTESYTSRRKRD